MRVRASQSVIDGGLCLICLYRVHTDHWTIWWSHTNHTKSNPTFQASDSPLFLYYDVILTTVMLDSIQALDVVFFYSKFSNLVWNSLYYTSSSYYFFHPNLSSSFPLSCMDASIAIKPVFDRFQSVVITSGVWYHSIYLWLISYLPVIRHWFKTWELR